MRLGGNFYLISLHCTSLLPTWSLCCLSLGVLRGCWHLEDALNKYNGSLEMFNKLIVQEFFLIGGVFKIIIIELIVYNLNVFLHFVIIYTIL